MKSMLILMAVLILFTSCAKRPDGVDEDEALETEIVWVEPPKSYLDDLSEMYHYLNAPDSVFCYIDPLIKEDDYVQPNDLEYDWNAKKDTRFISCNQYVEHSITTVLGDDGQEQVYGCYSPNIVYLTEANTKRTKLCPYEWCRNDFYAECGHLDIDAKNNVSQQVNDSIVYGNAVYFTWCNRCVYSPDNPRFSKSTPYVHMLMKYDLETHTVDKVLDLPGYTLITGADFGILYLYTYEGLTDVAYMILLDTENFLAAKAPLSDDIYFAGHVYLRDDGFYIHEYKNGTRRCDPLLNFIEKVDKVPENRYKWGAGEGGGSELLYRNDDGSMTTLMGNVHRWYESEDYIYILEAGAKRLIHTYPDHERFRDMEDIHTSAGTTVTRYKKLHNGFLDQNTAEVVFEEGVSCEDSGEMIYTIEPYGNTVRVVTGMPSADGGDYPMWRRYIVTRDSAVIDGETIGNDMN